MSQVPPDPSASSAASSPPDGASPFLPWPGLFLPWPGPFLPWPGPFSSLAGPVLALAGSVLVVPGAALPLAALPLAAGPDDGPAGAPCAAARGQVRGIHRDRRLGRRQVRPPHPVRSGFDLIVGAPAQRRLWVVLRIPALDGVLVVLVQQQPLLLTGTVRPAPPHQDEPAAQLLPVKVGVKITGRHRGRRVVRRVRLPRTGVPHDHVAAAILPGRDDPLEVQVLDGVILDVDGRVPDVRVQGRPLRHGPAHQHAVDLEPQVVVQPPRPVPLHDKPRAAGFPAGPRALGAGPLAAGLARRLRRLREIALLLVRREPFPGRLAGRLRRCLARGGGLLRRLPASRRPLRGGGFPGRRHEHTVPRRAPLTRPPDKPWPAEGRHAAHDLLHAGQMRGGQPVERR